MELEKEMKSLPLAEVGDQWIVPQPFCDSAHVDSAVGLFSTSFPALSPEARSQLLDGFKQSIKAVDGKSNTTTAFVLRNILSALLGASKALVAYGGGGKTSKSASKEQSSRAPWVVICKGLLVTALHSRDSLVRRSAAEAIGYMSLAVTDMSFAKSVEKTLYSTLKTKTVRPAMMKIRSILGRELYSRLRVCAVV